MGIKNKTRAVSRASHVWTKDEVRKLYKLWEDCTLEELSADMGIRHVQVTYMANQMRKVGFKLTKKPKVGSRLSMLKEIFEESKNG